MRTPRDPRAALIFFCFCLPVVCLLLGAADARAQDVRCTATKLAGAGLATRLRLDCEAIGGLIGIPTDPCRRLSDVTLRQTWAIAENRGVCAGEIGAVRGDVDDYADGVIGIVRSPRRLVVANQLYAAGAAAQAFASCSAAALLSGASTSRCAPVGQAILTSQFANTAQLLAVEVVYKRYQNGIDLHFGGVLFAPTPTNTPTWTPTPTFTSTATFAPTPSFTRTATFVFTPTPTPTPTVAAPACGFFGQPCCQPGNVCFLKQPCTQVGNDFLCVNP